MQDTIIREIIVKASQVKVFNAITDPEQIIKWFPDVVEGSFEVGEKPVFVFTEYNHKAQIYIEAIKPHEYFSYRWVPGAASTIGDVLSQPNTLVEFFIEEVSEGTKVTVKESGFSSLPVEVAEKSFSENTGGWEFMIGRLEKLMNQN